MLNLKISRFAILAALTLCCIAASAQHSTDFGAQSYNVGVTLSGRESIAVSADNKLGTYYFKPIQGLQLSRENMLNGSTYLTELTLGRSVFKELVKEPAYEGYYFETGNLFNVGLGFYYGYTLNRGKRLQVPIYVGGSLDYFRGGYFKNLSLDFGFKIRAKYYLTDQIGLFAGFNPSMGMSMGKQNRSRLKNYTEIGVIFSPFEQKRGYDVVTSVAGTNPKSSSDTGAMEKLFNDGLKNHDGHYHTYSITNPKKKFVKEAHMVSFVKSKGYIVISSNSITINRLGDRTMVLHDLTFISPGDYPEYVFKKLGTDYDISLASGSFLKPGERDVHIPINGSKVLFFNERETYFEDWNGVRWTGEIKDGYLHGRGDAYYNAGDMYYIFMGTFNHGLAVSDITVKTYKAAENGDYAVHPENVSISRFGPQGVKVLADQYTNAANEVIRKAIRYNLIDSYDGYAGRLEEAYTGLKPITVPSAAKFKSDPVVNDFLTLYRTCGYDPRGLIPKAQEMCNVYEVASMLEWTPRKAYFGFSMWSILSLMPEWYEHAEKSDRESLKKAASLARDGAKSSRFGFKSFFSNAVKVIDRKRDEFESFIDLQVKKYEAALKASRQELEDLHARMEREIDQSRSYAPKGELENTSLIYGSEYKYKENGKIYTKHGNHIVEYNIYYNKYGSEYELDSYRIHYASGKFESLRNQTFKSYNDMMNALMRALN